MKKKILSLALVASLVMQVLCVPVVAAEDSKMYIQRSHPVAGWVKSTLSWTHTANKVKESYAIQSMSGVMVDAIGVELLSKKKKKHKWECKTQFVLGLDLPIGTFGYKKIWSDVVVLKNAGDYSIEWDN